MNNKTAQKFLLITIVTTMLLFLIPAAIVFTMDPYTFFHKPLFMKTPTYSGTSRYQNAGLINSLLADPAEKIDSIIIGTSLSENFPVEAMKNKDGVAILKLTVAGSKPGEQNVVLEKALRTGRVKHVVWEMSNEYVGPALNSRNEQTEFPFFLYSHNILDQAKYVFNNDVVERAIGLIKGRGKGRQVLSELYTWDSSESFSKFASEDNLDKLAKELRVTKYVLKAQPYKAAGAAFVNLDKYVLPYLRQHPEIQFDLYFPPITYYQYALMGNATFAREMDMREYIMRSSADLKNVKIYGFDLIDGTGNNMKNYRDMVHYKPEINAMMARSIVQHNHQITLKTWPAYKAMLIYKINGFTADFLRKRP